MGSGDNQGKLHQGQPGGDPARREHLLWCPTVLECRHSCEVCLTFGQDPMVYGDYFTFQLSSADKLALSQEVSEIAAVHWKLMLTLEPWGGLSTVTGKSARDLATTLANYNSQGV